MAWAWLKLAKGRSLTRKYCFSVNAVTKKGGQVKLPVGCTYNDISTSECDIMQAEDDVKCKSPKKLIVMEAYL